MPHSMLIPLPVSSLLISESGVHDPVLLFSILLHPCLFWVCVSVSLFLPLSVHVRSDALRLAQCTSPPRTVLCEQHNKRNLWESKGTSDQAARLRNRVTSRAEFRNRTRLERQMAHVRQWVNSCYRQSSFVRADQPTSSH